MANEMEIIRKVKLVYGDEKLEKTLTFKEVSYEITKKIMLEQHYSHKWNTSFGKINIGVFENDILYGIASFGNLMNPKSYKNINKDFTQDNVVELNRLWVDDYLGKNTETILLSASWKIIRNNYTHVKAVQSFADGRLGCGTIYKASNFKYYGYTKTLFYENTITKEVFHNVPFDNTMRPDGMIKLNSMFVRGELKPFFVKTYKYIMPLYKNVVIDFKEEKYPDYDIGLEYIDVDLKENTMARSFVLSYILDYKDYYDFLHWAKENKSVVFTSLKNESIIKICEQRNKINLYNQIIENPSILFSKNNVVSTDEKQMSIFDFLGGN